MVPSLSGGLEEPRTFSRPDDAWRLLERVSQVRWAAIALGTAHALLGSSPGEPALPLLVLAATAAGYNTAILLHARVPRLDARRMALITTIGDFIWITGAAVILARPLDDVTAVIGYVVLASESGLLFGWLGAVTATAAAVASIVGIDRLVLAPMGGALPTGEMAEHAAVIGLAAVFSAVGAAEMRRQHRDLAATTAELQRHARTDHLTRLGNAQAIEEALTAVQRRAYGLLLIDVDRMHWANVVYGHQAGDEMLLGVARVLAGVRGREDLAARLGEDKFILLLPGVDQAGALASAEEVRAAMHGVAVSGAYLRVSIGCAWSPGGEDPTLVVERADDALYAAKAAGGDRVVAQGGAGGRGRWRLRDAVQSILDSERGVYSVFQPIVRLRDGVVVGWEALSRPHDWPPDADVEAMFLTAHRMGRGRDLDWRCRRNALWEAARLTGSLFLNINVAGLVDPVHAVDQMLLLCEWAGRAPEDVVLELTERDAMPDLRRLERVLAEYRAAGFRFALDDLGEGQTTLEVVLAARPEFLKLARPLVQASRTQLTARSGARALVTFAHDIGSTVVAEGVEDGGDRDLCLGLQIDLGQGWLFGRPQPAERLPS